LIPGSRSPPDHSELLLTSKGKEMFDHFEPTDAHQATVVSFLLSKQLLMNREMNPIYFFVETSYLPSILTHFDFILTTKSHPLRQLVAFHISSFLSSPLPQHDNDDEDEDDLITSSDLHLKLFLLIASSFSKQSWQFIAQWSSEVSQEMEENGDDRISTVLSLYSSPLVYPHLNSLIDFTLGFIEEASEISAADGEELIEDSSEEEEEENEDSDQSSSSEMEEEESDNEEYNDNNSDFMAETLGGGELFDFLGSKGMGFENDSDDASSEDGGDISPSPTISFTKMMFGIMQDNILSLEKRYEVCGMIIEKMTHLSLVGILHQQDKDEFYQHISFNLNIPESADKTSPKCAMELRLGVVLGQFIYSLSSLPSETLSDLFSSPLISDSLELVTSHKTVSSQKGRCGICEMISFLLAGHLMCMPTNQTKNDDEDEEEEESSIFSIMLGEVTGLMNEAKKTSEKRSKKIQKKKKRSKKKSSVDDSDNREEEVFNSTHPSCPELIELISFIVEEEKDEEDEEEREFLSKKNLAVVMRGLKGLIPNRENKVFEGMEGVLARFVDRQEVKGDGVEEEEDEEDKESEEFEEKMPLSKEERIEEDERSNRIRLRRLELLGTFLTSNQTTYTTVSSSLEGDSLAFHKCQLMVRLMEKYLILSKNRGKKMSNKNEAKKENLLDKMETIFNRVCFGQFLFA